MLRNPLYCGWVTLPSDESFKPVRGLHEPLISQETFDAVQAILDGRKPSTAPKRKFNPDFPLKCLARCEACGTPLTGGFCAGSTKRYAYYWCRNRDCRVVKLAGERLETTFVSLLRRLQPDPETVSKLPKVAAAAWAERQGDSEKERNRLMLRLEEQKRRKRKLLDSMLDGTISKAAYSEANEDYEAEIAVTEHELQALNSKSGSRDAFLRFAEVHAMDIAGAWQMAGPEQRQRVQNLLFEGGLDYSQEAGSLNPTKPSLFSILEATGGESSMLAWGTHEEMRAAISGEQSGT